jgi:hypothetical protein
MLRLAGLFAIILIGSVVAVRPATAAGGSVFLQPASVDVEPGGSADVDLVIDPPSETVSIWIYEVEYDPAVVEVTDCSTAALTFPPDVAGAAGCATKDTNADGIDDTAVAFGGWVENVGGTARGFDTQQVVATFTFHAIGDAGDSTVLGLTQTSLLGPNAEDLSPPLSDGEINITGHGKSGEHSQRPCWADAPWRRTCQVPGLDR